MEMMIVRLFSVRNPERSESIINQKQKDCKFANSRIRIIDRLPSEAFRHQIPANKKYIELLGSNMQKSTE